MMVIPIPVLEAMPLLATRTLATEVAQFAAGRAVGEELPGWVIAADQRGTDPIFVYLQEDMDIRVIQVGVATALMATRDEATSALWLCDTFIATRAKGSELDVDPSDDPKAVEALLIAYVTVDAGWTVSIPYHRGDRGELTWEVPEFGWKQIGAEIDGPMVEGMMRALRAAPEMGAPPPEPPGGIWEDLGIDMRGRA